ncbi:MAG: hypothetical protein HOD64_00470, partial [Candidatus Cloacimonetes bacterium]|nr:hypothetical protein [Candidatus Cloacimonadota bacterium]
MPKFFNSKSKQLEGDIDGFLDRVTTAGLIFQEGVKAYVKGKKDKFERSFTDITALESDFIELAELSSKTVEEVV